MSVFFSMCKFFWKQVEKSDALNIADQTEPEGVKRVYDIAYDTDGNPLHKLDVYYPENTEDKLPVIIDIHGGGWMYGNKELNRIYCLNLAKRGFVVFNMSYRLVPEVMIPGQLQDIFKALKCIEKLMPEYPCDGKNIMITGDSAGGMLSVYTTAILSDEKLNNIFGTEKSDIKPTALLLTSPVAYTKHQGGTSLYAAKMWGKVKGTPVYDYMNLDEVGANAVFPPTYLLTSSGDSIAQEQTKMAYEFIKSKGNPTEIRDFPKYDGVDLPHVFSVLQSNSKAGIDAIDGAIDFYRKHMV